MRTNTYTRFLLPIFAIALFISCQEEHVSEEIDLLDVDMIAATKLADEYMNASRARYNSERSITVVRFENGKLIFGTNTDDYKGYQEVSEESITATVEPGEYIFWYSGGGLSELDQIEFDEDSQLRLVESPEEINDDKMWVISIPEDFDEEDGMLKYDIVYQYKGNDGPPIRLDPKIKVNQ